MAADFFVVPTAIYRLLFVLVILAHERRRVVHLAVTDRPTATWTAQQLRNAFPGEACPSYLLHDGDSGFGDVARTIAAMQIQDVVTAVRSPWQNAYVERFIGSIRECLDHVMVSRAAGLHRVLADYAAYYMRSRTHLGLDTDPEDRIRRQRSTTHINSHPRRSDSRRGGGPHLHRPRVHFPADRASMSPSTATAR
jgi:putative transposase